MELRHINYFLAVAEDLHFRKAAERLYISQPGLSRQIKQLEEELGFDLFERNNKKVALTKAGEYLRDEFIFVNKHLEKALAHAQLVDAGKEGELHMGYLGSAMQNVIPNLLLSLKRNYPNIHFTLKEMENPDQISALLQQEIDLGFVRLNRVPRGLKMIPVFEDTFSLVLPENHPLTTDLFKSLKQLKDEEFILFEQSYSPFYFEQVMQLFDKAGFDPKISHNSVHAGTIFKLVENNLGISIVPTALQKGYTGAIKFIELRKLKLRTTLSAVWNSENRNPLLKNIIDSLNEK
ncbi:LysR family transcriptional regulator [Urechidicola sp. KH5]